MTHEWLTAADAGGFLDRTTLTVQRTGAAAIGMMKRAGPCQHVAIPELWHIMPCIWSAQLEQRRADPATILFAGAAVISSAATSGPPAVPDAATYTVSPQACRIAIWTGDGGNAGSNSPFGSSGGCAMKRGRVPRCGCAAWTRNGWHR